ncbi:MAG: type II/IV secretion system protein, partial [Gemmataceae bacterium]
MGPDARQSLQSRLDCLDIQGPERIGRLVDLVFEEALEVRASDIHFEPQADKISLRFRLDGVLHHVADLP